MLQTVKPRARWLHPGNVMVMHPASPNDGWTVFHTCIDTAVREWYRLTLNNMVKPVEAGTVVAL